MRLSLRLPEMMAVAFSLLAHLAVTGIASYLVSDKRVASSSAPVVSFELAIEQIESAAQDEPETEHADVQVSKSRDKADVADLQTQVVARAQAARGAERRPKQSSKPAPAKPQLRMPLSRDKVAAASPLPSALTSVSPALTEAQRIDYFSRLQAHIEAHKYYPRRARKLGIEGVVEVSFLLADDAGVRDIRSSNGHRMLNQSAVRAIRDAMPLPRPPAGMVLPLTVKFTMHYDLQH